MAPLCDQPKKPVEGVFAAPPFLHLGFAVSHLGKSVIQSNVSEGFQVGIAAFFLQPGYFVIYFIFSQSASLAREADVASAQALGDSCFFAGPESDIHCGGDGHDKPCPNRQLWKFLEKGANCPECPDQLDAEKKAVNSAVEPRVAFIESAAICDLQGLLSFCVISHCSGLLLEAPVELISAEPECWVVGYGSWWLPLVSCVGVCRKPNVSTVEAAANSAGVMHG